MQIQPAANNQALNKLERLYRQATQKIIQEINSSDDFSQERRLAILAETTRILSGLSEESKQWAVAEIQSHYEAGGRMSAKLLNLVDGGDIGVLQKAGVLDYLSKTDPKFPSQVGLDYILSKVPEQDRNTTMQAWANYVKSNRDEKAGAVLDSISSLSGIKPNTTEVTFNFTTIDQESVKRIVEDSFVDFGDAITGIDKATRRLMSQAEKQYITARLAEGRILGEARKKISADIANRLRDGFIGIKDKSGKVWQPDVYARMLARTKLTDATNTGLSNELLKRGYDLVIVSEYGTEYPLCKPFEGKVLSLTGATKGYKTVEEARSLGLFHPNCKHRLLPYHPIFADLANSWINSVKS